MEDAAVFSTLAQCFGPVGEDEWNELTESAQWSDFLAGARRLLQDNRPLGAEGQRLSDLRARLPLQEFLRAARVPPVRVSHRVAAAGAVRTLRCSTSMVMT